MSMIRKWGRRLSFSARQWGEENTLMGLYDSIPWNKSIHDCHTTQLLGMLIIYETVLAMNSARVCIFCKDRKKVGKCKTLRLHITTGGDLLLLIIQCRKCWIWLEDYIFFLYSSFLYLYVLRFWKLNHHTAFLVFENILKHVSRLIEQ